MRHDDLGYIWIQVCCFFAVTYMTVEITAEAWLPSEWWHAFCSLWMFSYFSFAIYS